MLFPDYDVGNRLSPVYGFYSQNINTCTLPLLYFVVIYCILWCITVAVAQLSRNVAVKYIFMTYSRFKVVGRNVVTKLFESEAHV